MLLRSAIEEAQWSSKSTTRDKSWVGYKAQVAETVQAQPRATGAFPSTNCTPTTCSPTTGTGVPRRSPEPSDGEGGYALALNTAKARVETFALSRFKRLEGTEQTFT
jgi:hypothetical protein